MAPRATALRDRLSGIGACCCDCEIFLNGYLLDPALGYDSSGDVEVGEDAPSLNELPACCGVRRGSVQPCRNWVRLRRPRW
jgi:hypothetical protein